eukprot:1159755-Pelagomonas_calceolata.AAC.8
MHRCAPLEAVPVRRHRPHARRRQRAAAPAHPDRAGHWGLLPHHCHGQDAPGSQADFVKWCAHVVFAMAAVKAVAASGYGMVNKLEHVCVKCK